MTAIDDFARFTANVQKGGPEECWPWTGATNFKGYGDFSDRGQKRRAHRMTWELHYGPIPAGLFVLHRCDNRPCCNPNHLFLGTSSDNAWDRVKKGRQANAVYTTYQGKQMHLAEACRQAGITTTTLNSRKALGWPEHLWFLPARKKTQNQKKAWV